MQHATPILAHNILTHLVELLDYCVQRKFVKDGQHASFKLTFLNKPAAQAAGADPTR